MPIRFACPCGKAFQTQDEHAGKRTKCPACGQVLVIPGPRPAEAITATSSRPLSTAAVIQFACVCGSQFLTQAEHAGRTTKCPACGVMLTIPATRAVPLPLPSGGVLTAEARATPPARRRLPPPTLDDDEAPQPRGRERAQQSRSHLLLILGGVAGALFLLVGGGLAYWLF